MLRSEKAATETAATDLKEIQRQIRNLQEDFLAATSFQHMYTSGLHFSGHDTRVASDFMRGRGRAKGKVSNPSSEERKKLCVAVQEHFAARVEHGGCDPTAWVGVTQRELILSARYDCAGACKDLSPSSVSICCQNAAEVVGQLSLSLGCSHRSLENPGACTATCHAEQGA